MKLLLTSAGLTNESIKKSLRSLLEKDFDDAKLVFIPTAANLEQSDKGWLINNLVECQELGFKEVDIVDIAALSKEAWRPRLHNADVIVVGGGQVGYLMDHMRESGFEAELSGLLDSRVYVGISAGSMVTAPHLYSEQMAVVYGDEDIPASGNETALNLVDFAILPHFGSNHFSHVTEPSAKNVATEVGVTVYLLDDQTALQIVDSEIRVVSEGDWKEIK